MRENEKGLTEKVKNFHDDQFLVLDDRFRREEVFSVIYLVGLMNDEPIDWNY